MSLCPAALHLNPNFCMIGRTGRKSSRSWCCMSSAKPVRADFSFSFKKFIEFALAETKAHTLLAPSPLQENFNSLIGMDGRSELGMLSFEAPKFRLFRCLSIQGNDGMQVLDFAVFPRQEFDFPIFCANFFTAAGANIVVLDLNPLHCIIDGDDYKEKYYKHLIPLGLKYAELLPWGGKLTSESLRFFSPIVIWTKFTSSEHHYGILFSAFMEYYKAWLELMDHAAEEVNASQIVCNREAQHRYLTWRAEKDPGHRVLSRLVGEALAEEIVRRFLFNGVDELGSKTFLDYFPEYGNEDGTINRKRSMAGKSFENRPWDAEGNFLSVATISYELSEAEYADNEVNDPWVQRLLHAGQANVAWVQPLMTSNNYDMFVHLVIDFIVRRLEVIMVQKRFSQLGGLQLDRDARALVSHFCSMTQKTVRDKFARLTQMATILNLEKVSEILDFWGENSGHMTWRPTPAEVTRVLLMRVDFKPEAVAALKLS